MRTIHEPREARPFMPYDVPMIVRLTPHGVSLDSALRLTRGINTVEGAVMSAVPLADLGTPTFIVRGGDSDGFVGQFRHKSGEMHAHLTFIAPEPQSSDGEREWLTLLDCMVNHAARRGASRLHAEVEEASSAHELLVRAGFSTVARQQIWRRSPDSFLPESEPSAWRPVVDLDGIGVTSLYHLVVPRIVAQAEEAPAIHHNSSGLVLQRDGRILGWMGVQRGTDGIYLMPCLHPDLASQAESLLNDALHLIKGAEKTPVFIAIRRYQQWLESALMALHFEPWLREAVMARQAECRVEKPAFTLAYHGAKIATVSYGNLPDSTHRRMSRIARERHDHTQHPNQNRDIRLSYVSIAQKTTLHATIAGTVKSASGSENLPARVESVITQRPVASDIVLTR